MELSYLEKYQPHVDIESLRKILDERNSWTGHKAGEKYSPIQEKISQLNSIATQVEVDDYVHLVTNKSESLLIEEIAKDLIPWRKGPFKVDDLAIDSEWRSNLKWKRIQDSIGSLKDQVVLDIGCNNGYYMFQMLKDQPELVLGIDPVIHNKFQFEFINKIANKGNLKFELFGIEELPYFRSMFDTIFSMGIIYHHRHPLEQLMEMREALKSEGHLILETIGIPGEESICLFPEDRYSKMRNVWFLPTLSCLKNWLNRTGFTNIEVLSESLTTTEEQSTTPWCPPPFQSLEEFLDPNDKTKTVEGHPAPVRFCVKAQKKPSPIKRFD
ncbi:tRNA 5-methoxyuridine(34)/uridine 5-oxyacetic acid(34) synthase CmoB [Bacteriovorax sp. Seq25_V]|uniref:tRNA 5-methoxyuridine(34)/uridine 5-oxyacetic acid(34) synthase CmoB n=1 Tax=Bacteriovorax sp. Seq25_V TaxID=1201288 RepID=UPI00038A43D1|nr:tRNA 5-methoxyuridine(34)/uridine 5-oxyacetic acid(34) synthase CmoB [Bacteriovorax sp. Seq25_V]EQC45410.1 putative tRNA (mo5U34)-methyltransferase [Bacteriovorax sp. Seq25_V]